MPPATTSSAAMSNLQGFQSSMKSPDQAMQDASNAAGVPQAQQQVSGLRSAITNSTNLLDQVAPGVMGRTQGSLVTSAQADKQIANEQAPINTQLNKEQQDYTSANADYTNAETQAEARANAAISGQQNQLSYLQNIYSDLKSSEDQAAQQAEAKRQFDAQQALAHEQLAASRSASGGASPSFGGGSGAASAGSAAPPPGEFARGTNPQAALSQLFKGYNPTSDKYYTENTVLPYLSRLLALNNPHQSQDVINGAAQHLAYTYRKQNFGE